MNTTPLNTSVNGRPDMLELRLRAGAAGLRVALLAAALMTPSVAGAADPNPNGATAPRNPVEWLFNDLGRLVDAAAPDMGAPAGSIPPSGMTEAAAPTPDSPPANPIVWFLSDIGEVLTALPAAAPKMPDATAASPAASAEALSGNLDNPLAQLFQDLAALLTPPEPTPGTTDADAVSPIPLPGAAPATPEPNAPEAIAQAPTVSPAMPSLLRDFLALFDRPAAPAAAEPAPAPVQLAALPDAPAPAPEASPAAAAADIAPAPWRPTPNTAIFDPAQPLFGATPLAPRTVVVVRTEPMAAPAFETAAGTTPGAPPIRTLRRIDPAARNYAPLGRPSDRTTAEDETFVASFLRNIGLADDPHGTATAADASKSEPLANAISERIVPDEKMELAATAPDAEPQSRTVERIGTGPRFDIDLFVGRETVIGSPYDAADFDGRPCVEKPLQGSVFCLKDLAWPAEIARSFRADTAFARPGEGVVRFENGTLSRVYAVFAAGEFTEVVKFMQRRFGPPVEREVIWMHMLEAPRMPNTTFRWTAITADRRDKIVLEVRNYDDERRAFADMEHGLVRLYRDGSRPIFKHLSTMDLMLMQRRRLAHTEGGVQQKP